MSDVYDIDEYLNRDLLRFTTAGSVDDGKSTLIGRMLYDSKAIFQDQMDALEKSSLLLGDTEVDLALLTDGLRAEREQGITIDVAYRYFSTPRRKFIIADTPGHEQYTRNMVTGASTADLAIILIDARNGVLTQSRRHGFIASLLGIPHLVVAVNKMDLVGWSRDTFNRIVEEYTRFSEKLNIHDITFIPISALLGDNVVDASANMPWFEGKTVLHHLETVTISADRNLIDFRFPVQYVIRPNQNFRGFAGRVASGTIRRGEDVVSLPSMTESKIKEIVTHDGSLDEAFEGQSVILTLDDEIDVSRGDMIVRRHNIPLVNNKLEATICWMDDSRPLNTTTHYILQHNTRTVQAFVYKLRYRINVNTLHREFGQHLILNEIGRVEIETAHPLYFDPYEKNRETGGFVLIDPATNLTAAAGMIVREISETRVIGRAEPARKVSPNTVKIDSFVSKADRIARNGHQPHVFWFTGLSGSGKSTVAKEFEKELFNQGKQVVLLDGDNIRHGLNGDLGFSEYDRRENIRRIGEVARLFYDTGHIVLCCFISPDRERRRFVRDLIPSGDFSEVYVECDLEECKRRDPKGLYKKALAGEIKNFTGIDAPYDIPENPEILLNTAQMPLSACVDALKSKSP